MRWLRGVKAHYSNDRATIYHGDCIEVMRSLPDNSVDSVVTDPPYGLEFMGKEWDSPWKHSGGVIKDPVECGGFQDGNGGNPYSRSRIRIGAGGEASYGFQLWVTDFATETLRVLKPGGHLLAFGGTRTWHRLAVGIEDAGFEVRDSIAWMYGSGFPKSLDVSKAIDKRQGVEREVVGVSPRHGGGIVGAGSSFEVSPNIPTLTAPATPEAQQWAGWGTALKPAHEPIVVARKPLIGTVAENVLTHGTGALNIDGSRIGTTETLGRAKGGWGNAVVGADNYGNFDSIGITVEGGRWPANVILDESQAAELDRQSGVSVSVKGTRTSKPGGVYGNSKGLPSHTAEYGHNDISGASRFFYVAKANKSERPRDGDTAHPTVKPLTLMRYLCNLVTPPGGTILEPFAGSGTTVQAALMEGFNVIGIEMTDEYLPLIVERIERYGEMLF